MNGMGIQPSTWEENVFLIDADWLDRFVYDVRLDFGKVLKRDLPQAALDCWMDYLSLDAGLRPGKNTVQIILLYDSKRKKLDNCVPQSLNKELDGKAFKDNIGEFLFSAVPVDNQDVSKKDLFVQSLEALLSENGVKRLLLIPDIVGYGTDIQQSLNNAELPEKKIVLFSSQPLPGFKCVNEILTFSLLATLGISSEELGI